MNIESDHFKTLEELIDTIKIWIKIEEEFYDRWFGLNEMNILVKEIERLNNIINKLDKLIEQYSKNDYYYKYNGKYLKSEIINDLKIIRGVDKE